MGYEAGNRVGPYEILSLVGKGGMGAVYRARDTRLGREVAIKVLSEQFSENAEQLRRFEQEARSTSALNHPNIVTLFDVGSADGKLYIVTELLHGETLREALAGGPLPARQIIPTAQKVASSLAAAHAQGIVHRDLKPENIYLTKDGNVKILDFGVAKLDPAAPQAVDSTTMVLTEPGHAVGTPAYMSPEQILGEPVDGRSDIFSFGLVLYEMCTARRAFRAETTPELMTAILRQDPPAVSDTNPDVPEGLEALVRRCLEKRREDRFQSARDICFVLETLSPVTASRAQVRTPNVLPRRRIIWGLAALPLAGSWLAAAYLGRLTARKVHAEFRRITFRRGYVTSARFSPDGQTIIYSAAWDQDPVRLFSGRPDRPEYRALDLPSSYILSISSKSEMAILSADRPQTPMERAGTLSIAPLAGGAARELIRTVQSADWSPNGDELAIVRPLTPRYRLEYPVGKVLYETEGKIADPRVSPDGQMVAFIDQPRAGDDAGFVAVIDRTGRRRKLSRDWRSCQGLAWSPKGNEILFTAAAQIGGRQLYAVSLGGAERTAAAEADRLFLHDAAPSGKLLLTHELYRFGILGSSGPGDPERELSWLDASMLGGASRDGKTLVFSEGGTAAGGVSMVYMRTVDGAPPVQLGAGLLPQLSPDRQWVACLTPDPKQQVRLLPTGAGEARTLPLGEIEQVEFALWADPQKLLLTGYKGDQGRIYQQGVDGSPPKPMSPPDFKIASNVLTPDGHYAVGRTRGEQYLVSLAGAEPRKIAGIGRGDEVLAFSDDSRIAYVQALGSLPARVDQVEVATGQRSKWRSFQPSSLSGVTGVGTIVLAQDLKSYTYNYESMISDLYTLDGAI
ncbi:MAG TPA: protein kinase [Bryobacteraceae bacterium]|nr:protein kinase [Bryobacteraceae bacterium]